MADVYEAELAPPEGGHARGLTLCSLPGQDLQGRVAFVDPRCWTPRRRTAKARLDLPNPKGELKPEMYGEVVLRGQARKGLIVPMDAVLDAGTRKVAFVALGEGRFEPREVTTGTTGRDGGDPLGPEGRARTSSPGPTSWWIPNPASRRPWRCPEVRRPTCRAPEQAQHEEAGMRGKAPTIRTPDLIQQIIRFSAENRWLVLAASSPAVRPVLLDHADHPPGRPAGPQRHPGHRLLASGTAAPTSSRTRSPTPSSPACWARPRSRRCAACRTSGFPMST